MTGIRLATSSEDFNCIARLAKEIWNQHYVAITGQGQVDYMLQKFQNPQAVAAQVADGWEYYLLMDEEGGAGGYLALVSEADKCSMQLSKIYLRSNLRGRGLGRRALELAEDRCRQQEISRLWLTVNRHNSDSIAWYLRNGFANAGPVVTDIGGGYIMDDYLLEKRW
jgi:diamine N-acetyltransferase